ncbi:MAG TPA: hypothetical protein VE398_01115 [Acidobacteriota bacterium]|nr:hypothetical protein [Acidobacteriota bacterium]
MTELDEIRRHLNCLTDEELTSILREHDEEQWRPEVFDVVSSILRERCVSPVEAPEPAEVDILEETAGLDLVTVGDYPSYVDAETDRLALESNGLRTWIFDQYAPHMTGFRPGVRLQVLAQDLITAKGILESEPVPSSDLPGEIAEPPCPKCGSRKVTESAELVLPSATSSSSPTEQIWLYHCASCGYKWSDWSTSQA